MALQTGVGLSRILILAGAGYTGTIMMKNGKLSDVLAELQALLGGKGDQNSESDLTAQIRRLASEVQRMGAAQRITVVNGSGSSGNVTTLIIPVATVGALGYGYMWWKGLAFSDLMYVIKKSMGTAVTNLTKHLDLVYEALAVVTARETLQDVAQNLHNLQSMVHGLDGRMGSMDLKQELTVAGVSYLIEFANGTGNKMNVPKALQDQISSRPRLALPKVEEGLKALGLGDITLDRSASDLPGGIGNLKDKGRTLFRTCSIARC